MNLHIYIPVHPVFLPPMTTNMYFFYYEHLLAWQLQPCARIESKSTDGFFRFTVISDVSTTDAS